MKQYLLAVLVALTFTIGAGGWNLFGQDEAKAGATLRIEGSDTMLQVNLVLADQYAKGHPMKRVVVDGKGSSTGFAGLVTGAADIACSSRPIKVREKAKLKQTSGEGPVEHVVAYDAIAVFVHAGNKLDSMDRETLEGVFFGEGAITRWDQIPGSEGSMRGIEIFGRPNASGTYAAFKAMVAGPMGEYKKGIASMASSAAVVEAVGSNPQAMGYAGVSYATEAVKMLKLAAKKGGEPVGPTVADVRSGKYPLVRKLYYYTTGEPEGEVKLFIEWLKSDEAKKIISDQGFIAPE